MMNAKYEGERCETIMRRSLPLVVMILFGLLLFGNVYRVQAASLPKLQNELNSYYSKDGVKGRCFDNFPKGTTFSKMKSTNKKVATIYESTGISNPSITIDYNKVGKATISFKATVGKKSRTYKIKVGLYKWANPFKSVKIGSRSYQKYFKTGDVRDSNLDSGTICSGKVQVKLKKRYQLKKIFIRTNKLRDGYYVASTSIKTIRNGKKIKLTASSTKKQELYIVFYDTKTKVTGSCLIR